MNRIYKIIQSKVKQSFAVVSELSEGNGKSESRYKKVSCMPFSGQLKILSVAVLLALNGGQAYAGVCTFEDGPGFNGRVLCGKNTVADRPDAIAIGTNAHAGASGAAAVAIGFDSVTGGIGESVAVGVRTHATGDQTIALGNDVFAEGDYTIVIGTQYKGGSENTKSTGNNAVAIGSGEREGAAQVEGDNSIAIGTKSHTEKGADGGIALGARSRSLGESSIAIGQDSGPGQISTSYNERNVAIGEEAGNQNRAKNSVAIGTRAGTNVNTGDDAVYLGNEAGRDVVGATNVLIGKSAGNRLVGRRNVAIGKDAGKEIFGGSNVSIGPDAGVNFGEGTFTDRPGNYPEGTYTKAADNNISIGKEANNFAGGDSLKTSNNIAIGLESKAKGTAAGTETGQSIAIGTKALAEEANTVAMGTEAQAIAESSMALGFNSVASAKQSIAVGFEAKAKNWDDIAIGSGAETTTNSYRNIAIGRNAKVTNGAESIVIGRAVESAQTHGIAIGSDIKSNAYGAIVIGHQSPGLDNSSDGLDAVAIGSGGKGKGVAEADGDFSIVMGTDAKSETTAKEGIAIGRSATVSDKKGIAIGSGATASGEKSISVGVDNTVSGANSGAFGDPSTVSGNSSYSIGNNNTIANNNTFVLGSNIVTTQDNAIVLGNNSADKAFVQVNDATVNGVSYSGFAGTATGVVSVGAIDADRQIINVAPGEISATSTDAINGSQLYAVASQDTYFHMNENNGQTGASDDNLAGLRELGGAQGDFSMTAGLNAKATGVNAIAMGYDAYAGSPDGQVTQDLSNMLAVGYEARAVGKNSTALGHKAQAIAKDTVALGEGAEATGDTGIALGKQTDADGEFSISIGLDSRASGSGSVAIGSGAFAGEETAAPDGFIYATALGNDAKANAAKSVALGHYAQTDGFASVALGDSAVATVGSGVALGEGSVADVEGWAYIGVDPLDAGGDKENRTWKANAGAVSIGNGTEKTRQITSVAAGTRDTDAVNVAQLKAAGFKLTTSASDGEVEGSSEEKVKNGDMVTIDAGKNIKITQAGPKVTVATKDEVEFTKTTVGNVVTDATTNKITGLEAGTDDNDAVNVSQLKEAIAGAAPETYFHFNDPYMTQAAGDATTNKGGITDKAGATGLYSITAGVNAQATDQYGIAIGTNTKSEGAYAVVLSGNGSNSATGSSAVSMGYGTTAEGDYSTAMGKNTTASKDFSTAMGASTTASGVYSTAMGYSSTASGSTAFAVGSKATASGDYSAAIGSEVTASGIKAIALGYNTTSDGTASTAMGSSTTASGQAATAMGSGSKAIGDFSTAMGGAVQANGNYSTAMGNHTEANGDFSTAMGNYSTAEGKYSTAMGNASTAAGEDSLATQGGKAWTNDSIAIGQGTVAGTDGGSQEAVAMGYRSQATENKSLALGFDAKAEHENSVALGEQAETKAFAQVTDATVGGITYGGFAGTANGVVSVGKAGFEKQIVNVAPGEISETSTDAINGSQLHATNVVLDNVAQTTAANFGGGVTVGTDGKLTAPTYTLTDGDPSSGNTADYNNVGDALTALNTAVTKPLTFTGDTGSSEQQLGSTFNITGGDNVTTAVTDGEVTIDIDGQGLAEAAQLPVVYTDADGNKLYKQADGTFNTAPDGSGTTVQPADVIASMQNGEGNTTTPMTLANVASTLPGTAGNPLVAPDSASVVAAPTLTDAQKSNAATIDDVLNSGWNLQGNGTAVDFVKAYDTVNFIDGAGTRTVVTVDANNEVSTVTYNVNADNKTIVVKGTDGNGDTVYQQPDGSFNTEVDGSGTAAVGDVTDTEVAANTGDLTVNDGSDPANPEGTVTADDPDSLATSGDIADAINNSGFTVTSSADGGTVSGSSEELVNPGDTLEFVAGEHMNIVQDGSKFTFETNNQAIAEAAQLPVVYTDADGNKLYKQADGTFNTAPDGSGTTVQPADVIASMQNGEGNTTTPMTLANVASTLPGTAGNPLVAPDSASVVAAPTTLTDAQKSNAATVDDVLNAGWNLQGNGEAVDFVKAYDTVNFVDGAGTKAVVSVDANNEVSEVAYNVNADNKTIVVKGTDGNGDTVYQQPDGSFNTEVDGSGTAAVGDVTDTEVAANTTTLELGDGATAPEGQVVVPTGDDAEALATAGDIADVINNSGFTVAASANGGTVSGTPGDELINPGDRLDFVAGEHIEIEQDGSKFTFKTNNQAIANDAQLPVVYTKADGTKVYKQADGTFNEAADGSGTTVPVGDIIASMQGADGSTTNPSTLANVKSNIGNNDSDGAAIDPATAKTNVTNLLDDTDGLDKAATTGDLQAIAQAGLDFVGDDGTVIHKPLGSQLDIVGGADKTKLTDNNIGVNEDGGQLKVQLAKNIDLGADGSVKTGDTIINNDGLTINGGPSVTQTGIDAGGNKITNVAPGEISNTSTDAVNGSQLADVADTANAGWNITANGQNKSNVGPNDTVDFNNSDGNIFIRKKENSLTFDLNPNLRLTSVTTGNTQINSNGLFINGGPSVTRSGIDAGGQRITNVAPGINPGDAVNLSQLDEVDDDATRGTATALAAASLPQAYRPGSNLMTAGAGTYRGKSAVAVGYSAISDNGKWIFKGNASVNEEDAGFAVGVGYQW